MSPHGLSVTRRWLSLDCREVHGTRASHHTGHVARDDRLEAKNRAAPRGGDAARGQVAPLDSDAVNAEWLLMSSDVSGTAYLSRFSVLSLGINSGCHFAPSARNSSSFAPVKVPGRIDGGALAARIPSFSAGLARRYTSVVLISA